MSAFLVHSEQLSGLICRGICVNALVTFAKSVGDLLVWEEIGIVYVLFSLFHPLEATLFWFSKTKGKKVLFRLPLSWVGVCVHIYIGGVHVYV